MKVVRFSEIAEEERDGYVIRRLLTESLGHDPENAGFYLTTIPARGKVKCHSHTSALEIILFLTDGAIATHEDSSDFDPGDVAVLQPGEQHEIAAQAQEVRLIAVRLPNYPDDKVVCSEDH